MAKRLAADAVRRASPAQPIALVAAESAPRVAAPFAGDEKPLLAGLAALRATDAGGRIEDAVRVAGDLLAVHAGTGQIVLVTDRHVNVASSVIQQLTADGSLRENVGITRLAARALPNSPETDEVLVEAENFGPSRQTGSIELSYDGALLDVKPFDLGPGERRAEVYPAVAAGSGLANARGWLAAHLTMRAPDAFALDDDAFAVIAPPRPLRVLLVTRGNLYLESLLKADGSLRFDQLVPEGFQPAEAAGFDAVILDDVLPAGFEKPGALPTGNFLFVRRTPFNVSDEPVSRPAVTDLDAANPLLRLVNLRETLYFQAAALALPETAAAPGGWRFAAPVRSLEHPLVVTGERRGQRLAAFAFGVTDSELPLRVAFPLLVRNTLHWLASRDDAATTTDLRTGEPARLPAGAVVWDKPQRVPAALPAAIPSSELRREQWQPLRNGFYLRRGADGQEDWLAVNTGDRAMSALNTGEGASSGASATSSIAWTRLPAWPPWTYLALAAFALCAGEWWTFHRRRSE